MSGSKGRDGKLEMESGKEDGVEVTKGAIPGTKLALRLVGGSLD